VKVGTLKEFQTLIIPFSKKEAYPIYFDRYIILKECEEA
jgi:hypothetical protein